MIQENKRDMKKGELDWENERGKERMREGKKRMRAGKMY